MTIKKQAGINRKILHFEALDRWIRVFLCALIIVSMAGCYTSKINDASGTVTSNTVTANTDTAESRYYSVKELDLYQTTGNEYVEVISMVPCSDQLAVCIAVHTYERLPDGTTKDSSKKYAIFFDQTGKKTAQIDFEKVLGPNEGPINFACNLKGDLVVLSMGNDTNTSKPKYNLYSFDSSGNVDGEPIQIVFEDVNYIPAQVIVDTLGNVLITGYNSDFVNTIIVFDSKGKQQFEITDPRLMNYNLLLSGDTIYANSYENGNEGDNAGKFVLYPIEMKSGELGKAKNMTVSSFNSFTFSGKKGLYCNDETGVSILSLKDMMEQPLLLWENIDIDYATYINCKLVAFSDDTIFCLGTSRTSEYDESKLSVLRRQSENPDIEKQTITVAGVDISDMDCVLETVFSFNKANDAYHVKIKNYADSNAMYLDVLAGLGPDVIIGNIDMTLSQYESQDLLVDLYPLMDKDSTFHKDDYLSSILKICETDGRLYKIPTSFAFDSLVGARSKIGIRSGWTVDEFVKVANGLPTGMQAIANNTQSTLLKASINTSMTAFVEPKTGICNFESDGFYKLLDWAKTYGVFEGGNTISNENSPDERTLVQDDKLALVGTLICDPSSYASIESIFGEPISVVGFPSSTKSGPLCGMGMLLGISAQSKCADGAWSYLKTFFSEEEQQKIVDSGNGIPIKTSVFEKQIAAVMNQNESDTNGETNMTADSGFVPLSEESAQGYRELVYSLANVPYTPEKDVLAIIMEEVPSYFHDQKSAEEVADVIQNRVQTVVDEQ